MNSFQIKNISLDNTKKEVIKSIIEQKQESGLIISEEQVELEKISLEEKINKNSSTLEVINQEDITDAAKFNSTQENILLDIHSAFYQMNLIEQTINKHQKLNQSLIGQYKNNIKQIKNEIEKYYRKLELKGEENYIRESFYNQDSFELLQEKYKDRYGKDVLPIYHASLRTDKEDIVLSTIKKRNTIVNEFGTKMGNIEIGLQLGVDENFKLIKNPETDIEKAIDTSEETFWVENIFVNQPIEMNIKSKFDSKTNTPISYDGVEYGAACELYINFKYITEVNEISLKPFSEFPIELVFIEYYLETSNDYIRINLNTNEKIYLNETSTFQFETINTKRIRILLNQVHYTFEDFSIDKKEYEKQKLWRTLNGINEKENKSWIKDKLEIEPTYSLILEGHEIDLNQLKEEQTGNMIHMKKIMYQYGLYHIGVYHNDYHEMSVYISKPVKIEGNIGSLLLETKEQHPISKQTDIEYYIEYNNTNNWIPIVPSTYSKIYSEKVKFEFNQEDERYEYELRVKGKSIPIPILKKNGVSIEVSKYSYSSIYNKIYMTSIEIGAIYTVEYLPADSAKQVDFISYLKSNQIQPFTIIEEFYGTNDNGVIELNHYPYVNKEFVLNQNIDWNPSYLSNSYVPMKIKILTEEGRYIEQPLNSTEESSGDLYIINKTNYKSNTNQKLSFRETELAPIEYESKNREIKFNYSFSDKNKIVVEYKYFIDTIRLKAILRQNNPNQKSVTPILSEYTIRYQKIVN